MNTAILIGNTGRDPEIKNFEWGTYANVSLATNRTFKTKDGEKKKVTQWHNLEFRGKLADVVEKYVKKGDSIRVTGEIQYQEYEKDGQKKYITKIACHEMEMLGSRTVAEHDNTAQENTASAERPQPEMPEDDLPF